MAVFLTNKCKWNGCGITFPNLGDLIQHIEDTHIDYDPKVVEQKEQAQPACLPLSYVLRFISEDARKESPYIATPTNGSELKRKLAIKHHTYSMSSSNRSNTPTGSEMDEDEMVVTESEDSNDSWTTEEFSSEFIMRYGSRHSGTGSNGTPGNEKPFACPVPGCKKRYKNVNGIKYHSKNGHKKDGKVRKGYKCHCGKSYKTAQGLKNHALASHNTTTESTLTTQHIVANSGGILLPRSTSPSQSLGSLSPSSISNMSSSASSCHGGNGGNSSNAAILQHLTNGVSATITTSNVNGNNLQIQQQQPQSFTANTAGQQQLMQQQQQPATIQISGNNNHNSNNSYVRSTIGLVSIKANNASGNAAATAATNLLAANAAASKILKLAQANAANSTLEITHHQHQLQQQQQQHQLKATALIATPATPTKITLPSLVNLGILTPSASPTKPLTQGITFSQQQQSQPIATAAITATAIAVTTTQLQREITISGNNGSGSSNGSGSNASTNTTANIVSKSNNNNNSSKLSAATNVVVVENIQTQTEAQTQTLQETQTPTPPPPPLQPTQQQQQQQQQQHQTPTQPTEKISLPLTPISSNGLAAPGAKSKTVVATTTSTPTTAATASPSIANQSMQQIPATTTLTIQHKTTLPNSIETSNSSSGSKVTSNANALLDSTGTFNEET